MVLDYYSSSRLKSKSYPQSESKNYDNLND